MKPTEPAPVLHIYTRVSTTAQEEQGTSLSSQEKLGRERAKALGFDARLWNEGGKSSNHEEIAGRPVLQALVNEIANGSAKHVFVYDQSRLSRNDNVASAIRYQCKKNGVTLYTKDGKYDFTNASDTFLKQVLDAMAEFDNAGRAERTRLGKLQRVKQHQWHGGPPPFGYRLESKKLVVEKAEAAKVKEIYQRYASGESVYVIKKYLDKSGVLPRRGGAWTGGSILKILENTHYVGYYIYRDGKSDEQLRVECIPIVSSSNWQAAQEKRKTVLLRKGQVNRTKHFYLLRDLMYCGFCNAPLGARTKASKNEHFYYCPTKERDWKKGIEPKIKHSKKDGCGFARSMNIDQADKLVWDVVIDIHAKSSLLKEEVKKQLIGGIVSPDTGYEATQKKNEKSIKLAEKELQRADEAITELEVEHRLGRTDAKLFPQIMKRLREQRITIQARIETLREGARNQAQERKWVDWVKAFGDEVKLKSKMTPEERKEYLRGMIERIDVKFLAETKEHRLEIRFIKPIVGDGIVLQKPKGYRLRKGATSKLVSLPMRGPPGKRATPVGNNSVTVE
ncbi:recombinase family protein [Lysobacter sp. 5GHs7-4]|uniref:recombinase family protein n=1 Tax=Lysobacter sp. 5GHs7-4 TaxID=2904253 RepID=UPI001E491C4B|nr:recombinase family protein [Lysobacter sp. 5GHs7-4]UHQ23972.1 recombinase family protein [Lysobacter sp. 5GHs7-4]